MPLKLTDNEIDAKFTNMNIMAHNIIDRLDLEECLKIKLMLPL